MQLHKNITIRVDINQTIGAGHFMRMLALAQAWHDRGNSIFFVLCQCTDSIKKRLKLEGFLYEELNLTISGSREDAELTSVIANKLNSKWIIMDGYVFGYEYQIIIQNSGIKTAVIDDHGYCIKWASDLIINQNPSAVFLNYGREETLLGTNYALLRREFIEDQQYAITSKQGKINNLLISFGGADPLNATSLVLNSLIKFKDYQLEIRIILGPANTLNLDLHSISTKSIHNIKILRDITDMRSQYLWADGFIGAGGSTCWELIYYKIRSALIPIATNQLKIVKSLETKNIACVVGSLNSGEININESAINNFILNPDDYCKLDPSNITVDGKGSLRIAAKLDDHLKICIATPANGWLLPHITSFISDLKNRGHQVIIATRNTDITKGDILLLLSYTSIIPPAILELNTHNLVIHASDLPRGRGWSPWIWEIIQGKSELTMSLIEAREGIDTGPIYFQENISLNGYELLEDLRKLIVKSTLKLCNKAINEYPNSLSNGKKQEGTPTYFRRRTPNDSKLNIQKSIKEQFNLLRTVDNMNYPAYFQIDNHTYVITIERKPKY